MRYRGITHLPLLLAAAYGWVPVTGCGSDEGTAPAAHGTGGGGGSSTAAGGGGHTDSGGSPQAGAAGEAGIAMDGGPGPGPDAGSVEDASGDASYACEVKPGTNPLASPDGKIVASVTFDTASGKLSYAVKSGATTVIDASALGLVTDLADFTGGLTLMGGSCRTINEIYTLPAGKKSPYVNFANELVIKVMKDQKELDVTFRAYDDGVAFRYSLPGSGNVSISAEATTFKLSGADITYWGEPHPNDYGNESPITSVTGTGLSTPVLAEMKDAKHWLFLAQAATYGSYVITWFQRTGSELAVRFPMDQTGPVTTTLPFDSPWKVAVVSPDNLAKMVETTIIENLNPPTEPELVNASWIKAGRATWDFIAGNKNNPNSWVDFDAEMGWEYHVLDAGWQNAVSDINAAVQYATQKNVAFIVWGNAPSLDTPAKAEAFLADVETKGLRGAKLDFFDRAPSNPVTNDYEDTQIRIQVRDMLCQTAAKHHLLVEFHGSAIPSGERRRWPNFLAAEGVRGVEHHPLITQDVIVPFTRNVMGPMDYTLIDYKNTTGVNTGGDTVRKTNAGQVATTVLFESGLQIFVPTADYLRGLGSAVDFLKRVPAAWDETRFVEGYPGSYATIARRKGKDWFVGTITVDARTAVIPLGFLEAGVTYGAELYEDGATNLAIVSEKKMVTKADTLNVPCKMHGGAAIRLAAP
jgi:alpha-glucosidase